MRIYDIRSAKLVSDWQDKGYPTHLLFSKTDPHLIITSWPLKIWDVRKLNKDKYDEGIPVINYSAEENRCFFYGCIEQLIQDKNAIVAGCKSGALYKYGLLNKQVETIREPRIDIPFDYYTATLYALQKWKDKIALLERKNNHTIQSIYNRQGTCLNQSSLPEIHEYRNLKGGDNIAFNNNYCSIYHSATNTNNIGGSNHYDMVANDEHLILINPSGISIYKEIQ